MLKKCQQKKDHVMCIIEGDQICLLKASIARLNHQQNLVNYSSEEICLTGQR